MFDEFTAALARTQSDYEFFIGCQVDPVSTLAGYDLTAEEVAVLTDPERLAMVLNEDLRPRNRPSITISISGRHDWVNRTPRKQQSPTEDRVVHEVASLRQAGTDEERSSAALRLIEQIG
jgi:hypothetical protein